jgi:hypothetical protein
MKNFRNIWLFTLFLIGCLLSACSSLPTTPRNTENLCSVFKQKNGWYQASKAAYQKWGVPIPVQMAIMHQESHFVADAQPPLGFFSWLFNSSSAYGYSQAQDETWSDYRKKTGNWLAQRDNFEDSCDFIGWYSQHTIEKLGVPPNDARNLYLAYHEGWNGFKRQTYNQKSWLLTIASKVEQRAELFSQQLNSCR